MGLKMTEYLLERTDRSNGVKTSYYIPDLSTTLRGMLSPFLVVFDIGD